MTLPGWTIKVDEISNGVCKVTFTDSSGHQTEVVDVLKNETIQKGYKQAFEIEKEVSKDWKKFLYELCLDDLSDITITDKSYNDHTLGSWFIQVENKRLVYLGAVSWLVTQIRIDSKWRDQAILRKEELEYSILMTVIGQLRPKFHIS